MWKEIFSKLNLIRIGVAIAAVAIILAMLPRADHKSFSYELNQPWKYPLLTAEFDIPILRDSTSMRSMRDSIDRTFVPFVKRDNTAEKESIEKFTTLVREQVTPEESGKITSLLAEVYENGVLDTELYSHLKDNNIPILRLMEGDKDNKSIVTVDATKMLSPIKAYSLIDSIYNEKAGDEDDRLSPDVSKALNISIVPNIIIDSVTDEKYRSQEYLTVTGAMGVIKTGQRIVDRGEIITPQIFTNLNTYQEMLTTRQSDSDSHTYFLIGEGVYIVTVFFLLYLFLAIYRPRFYSDSRKMTFLMSFITFFSVFAILMFEYVANGLYIVPFAALPVIILVFFDSRTAIFSLLATVLIAALVATYQFQFIFMELFVGLTATFSIRQLSRRSQLLRTAGFSFLAYAFTYFIICLITEGNLSQFSWRMLGMFAINSVILSFAYVLILIIEKLFGFTSTVTLVELSDINNPLLRRLAEEAPGTFQHSIQVSTIAAEAARAIGANTTLVRTGALYHDIGKLSGPVFYTENQHGVNPHAGLDPETSAQKIISHVTEGATIASKNKLPAVIKSFILEHHGKGMAKYFYNTAMNANPDGNVDKAKYTYPGPNPQSVETAILMMADAVEAASRSLSEYNTESINRLVDNIINGQIADGLFKESPITFKDVETIKKIFKSRLSTIYHSRVSYPELKKKKSEENAETPSTMVNV